jgi:RNA polymerase-binding transcription factor DksA
MVDKRKIKEKLEKERDMLVSQMKDMGKLNPETGEWEATPDEIEVPETDQNNMADRFEDFESRSSMIKALGPRLMNIVKAIKSINRESFGKCEVCKKDIEIARLNANPAARTCKKHLDSVLAS